MGESGSTSESFQDRGCTSGITKGRCHACNIVWYWKTGTRRLKDTHCPVCGGYLRATTHLTKSNPWAQLPADKTRVTSKFTGKYCGCCGLTEKQTTLRYLRTAPDGSKLYVCEGGCTRKRS